MSEDVEASVQTVEDALMQPLRDMEPGHQDWLWVCAPKNPLSGLSRDLALISLFVCTPSRSVLNG